MILAEIVTVISLAHGLRVKFATLDGNDVVRCH